MSVRRTRWSEYTMTPTAELIRNATNPVRVRSIAEATPLAPGIRIKRVRGGLHLPRLRSR